MFKHQASFQNILILSGHFSVLFSNSQFTCIWIILDIPEATSWLTLHFLSQNQVNDQHLILPPDIRQRPRLYLQPGDWGHGQGHSLRRPWPGLQGHSGSTHDRFSGWQFPQRFTAGWLWYQGVQGFGQGLYYLVHHSLCREWMGRHLLKPSFVVMVLF